MPKSLGERVRTTAAAIREAFKSVPYPGDENIGKRTPGYLKYHDYEGREAERFFAGRRWQDITLAVLRKEYDGDSSACLAFMAPQAFRYYLPAYMLIALDDFEAADMTGQSAVNSLILGQYESFEGPEDRRRFEAKVEGLTDEQRKAVAAFFLTMQEAHGGDFSESGSPARGLEAYWERYLPEEDKPLVGRIRGIHVPGF